MTERRYTREDLVKLSRDQLLALVSMQRKLWPPLPEKPFSGHKTNMADMTRVLLECPFTTTAPLPTSASSSSISGLSSDSALISEGSEREILLFVQDIRGSEPERVRVTVRVAHRIEQRGESTRTFRIDARDVLKALQASISPVLGPARIGVRDESDPSYTLYFATIDGAILSEPHPKHLFIQPLPVSSSSAAASPPSAPSTLSTPFHPRVVREPTDAELQWLTARLAATEGYAQFAEQHNRHLTNPQRVL
uniref:Uncharacterized protein n=1 Tax=Mycena chlorophos TaxID=658473 RepID=A0ABQ0KXB8_MYCCL|nr:predicted protein [Mycena chlorophos]